MRKISEIEGNIRHWEGVRNDALTKLATGHPAYRELQRQHMQSMKRLTWLDFELATVKRQLAGRQPMAA